jgi:hypothetical protein
VLEGLFGRDDAGRQKKLGGFDGDTLHLSRLHDASRKTKGGYGLEALSSDAQVIGPGSSAGGGGGKGLVAFGRQGARACWGERRLGSIRHTGRQQAEVEGCVAHVFMLAPVPDA